MAVCKGILSDAKRISEILDFSLKDNVIEAIAAQNEMFIQEILNEASEICIRDKRKVVSREDVKEAIKTRSLPFCDVVFE